MERNEPVEVANLSVLAPPAPPVAERVVPSKERPEPMVVRAILPLASTRRSPLPVASQRFVVEAFVAKSEVEVAAVVVPAFARKPPVKVDEAVERKPFKKPSVVEVETP